MQLGPLALFLPLVAVLGMKEPSNHLADQSPPTPPAPTAIETAMKATGYSYKELPGFMYLSLSFQDTKRTQTVYVRRAEDDYLSLKVNEVFSLVYDEPQPPSQEVILAAFQKRFTVGGLVLERPSEAQKNWRIRFKMEHFTTASSDRLKEVMNIVGSTGDFMEKELGPDKGDRL